MYEDPELQNLTKDQEEELLNELKEKRNLALTGVRASHTAVALDIQNTIKSIEQLVCCILTSLEYLSKLV